MEQGNLTCMPSCQSSYGLLIAICCMLITLLCKTHTMKTLKSISKQNCLIFSSAVDGSIGTASALSPPSSLMSSADSQKSQTTRITVVCSILKPFSVPRMDFQVTVVFITGLRVRSTGSSQYGCFPYTIMIIGLLQ
jgi:hypothetical protein